MRNRESIAVTVTDGPDGSCGAWVVDASRVERVRAAMWDDGTVELAAELFKILGSSTRMRILRALSTEELCVCDLSELLGLSSSAVSHQLRDLRRLRLVRCRTEGKLAYYSASDPELIRLLEAGVRAIGTRA
jgi:DNA-binding transcriptional ArsR family regulator